MDNPQLGFTQRLDVELKSCSMPSHDPRRGSTEELIRDMHRILTGNGDFNHGLIFKVASANTNLGMLQESVNGMSTKLDGQITKCLAIQNAHALEAAERTTVAKVGRAIWENKSLIFVIVLGALVYWRTITKQAAAGIGEEKLAKLVDARIEKILPGGTSLLPSKQQPNPTKQIKTP